MPVKKLMRGNPASILRVGGTERRKRAAPVANEAEILIVEDDEVIMGTLAYNLSRSGFGVSQAATGAEALRMARKLRPALILLDIMLPGESGIEVCERIRERDQGVIITIITPWSRSRILSHTSIPDSPGSMMSKSMRAGLSLRAILRASAPVAAWLTPKPLRER